MHSDITWAENSDMKRSQSLNRTVHRDSLRGFSILEVLIALLILSLGVLGALGMQVSALQSNKEVRHQAIATTFARELAEKMRGNHAVAIQTSAASNPYLASLILTSTTTISIPSDLNNCFKVACADGQKIAVWDMADWTTRLQQALPTPKIVICFDKTPFTSSGEAHWNCTDDGDIVVVKMAWTQTKTSGQLEFAGDATKPLVVVPLTAGSSE